MRRHMGSTTFSLDALGADSSDEEKAQALHGLSQLVDRIEGEAGWELCAGLRDQGVIDDVGALVGHPEPAIHQPALLLLATLTTEDVDAHADETKQRIKQCGAFKHVVLHLFSNAALTVAFSCATIQNCCADMELANALQDSGAVERLRELTICDQPQIVQAAKACLHNLMESMSQAKMSIAVIHAVVRLQRGLRRKVRPRLHSRPRPPSCTHRQVCTVHVQPFCSSPHVSM